MACGITQDFLWQHEVFEEVTLPDFSTHDVGQCDSIRLALNSIFGEPLFALKIYLNGDCPLNEGYVSIRFLKRQLDAGCYASAKCVVSIVDVSNESRYFQSFMFQNSDFAVGIERFIERRIVLENKDEFLPDDKITFRIEIAYVISSAEDFVPKTSETARRIPIKDLNEEGEKETYIIEIETQEGKTRTLIFKKGEDLRRTPLYKRSPVFATMLTAPMSEKRDKKVVIKDMKYETLENLLSFVESSPLVMESVQDIVDLYIAADKYQVMALRNECAHDLVRNFTIENAPKILALADMHSDKMLKTYSILYIKENWEEISETDIMKSVKLERPDLFQEIESEDAAETIRKMENFLREKYFNEEQSTRNEETPGTVCESYIS